MICSICTATAYAKDKNGQPLCPTCIRHFPERMPDDTTKEDPMTKHTLDGTYQGTLSGKTYDVRCGAVDFRNSCSMTNVDNGEISWVETPVMQEKIASGLLQRKEVRLAA